MHHQKPIKLAAGAQRSGEQRTVQQPRQDVARLWVVRQEVEDPPALLHDG